MRAEFWGPDSPDNPRPGSWFLKQVSLLGPTPSEIRGDLVSELRFMEALAGGRQIRNCFAPGLRETFELAEFAVVPTSGQAIARRAIALVEFMRARGREISNVEACRLVSLMEAVRAPAAHKLAG